MRRTSIESTFGTIEIRDFRSNLGQKNHRMKKNVIVFGLIIGTALTAMMLIMANKCYTNPKFETNDAVGYAALLAMFSLIFFGIRNYRDKYMSGIISFGQAFKVGAYISLIASAMYLVVWLFDFYIFIPDYLNAYKEHVLYQATLDGASQTELQAKAAEMDQFKEMYKNPVFVVLITLSEVLPLGLVVSLLSAFFLKKKPVMA